MKAFPVFLIALFIFSCKPKDKGSSLETLFNKDSTKSEITDKKGSPRELIIGKWKMKEAFPEPTSEEDKLEMLNTLIEFTPDGKVMVTSKGETKEEATFTLSMDDKYMLSTSSGKDEMDSIHIEEINAGRLVLTALKDNTRLILERQK